MLQDLYPQSRIPIPTLHAQSSPKHPRAGAAGRLDHHDLLGAVRGGDEEVVAAVGVFFWARLERANRWGSESFCSLFKADF